MRTENIHEYPMDYLNDFAYEISALEESGTAVFAFTNDYFEDLEMLLEALVKRSLADPKRIALIKNIIADIKFSEREQVDSTLEIYSYDNAEKAMERPKGLVDLRAADLMTVSRILNECERKYCRDDTTGYDSRPAFTPQIIAIGNLDDYFGEKRANGEYYALESVLTRIARKKRTTGAGLTVLATVSDLKKLPPQLLNYTYVGKVPLPDDDAVSKYVKTLVPPRMPMTPAIEKKIVQYFKGFRFFEIKNVVNRAVMYDENPFANEGEKFFPHLNNAKRQLAQKRETLDWIDGEAQDVGGMDEIKEWLKDTVFERVKIL